MTTRTQSPAKRPWRALERWGGFGLATSVAAMLSCSGKEEIAAISYECETSPELSPAPGNGAVCGADDPALVGLEPHYPTDVCRTLSATRWADDMHPPSEDDEDTQAIQDALDACKGKAVKLVATPTNNAFLAAHLSVAGVTLWVDAGVTLYASRDPVKYRRNDTCGEPGVNDAQACTDFITMSQNRPAIMGEGVIDGQGGERLIGHDYSWWQLSYALREVDGSIGNPTLINTITGTNGAVLYKITLHNSAKFHAKITSVLPAGETCEHRGQGFTIWGVTVLTPSKWTNSDGLVLTPGFARNTDGIDPGTTNNAECGLMVCNTISTGDDHIAIKGGHAVHDVTIAHNHFGTGHGMSIGSETYGLGIRNIDIYDLTIDADSRPVGAEAQGGDFNGIRIKSDASRGGVVENITYRDVCMRDMNNAILVSTAYNPLFAGTNYPQFGAISMQNVHHVTCMGLRFPVVTLNGYNLALPAGPISLDNVVIDNTGPLSASAQFSNLVLGPGPVSFGDTVMALSTSPSPARGGEGLTVTDNRNPAAVTEPKKCVFPTLPAPHPPPGWAR